MCKKLYFEEKGEELLRNAGLTKAEFARRMGICKQNVNSVFSTKNILMLRKAADILGVRFELLISYTEEPDLEEIFTYTEIVPRSKYIRIIIPYYSDAETLKVFDIDRKKIGDEIIRGMSFYDDENKQFDIIIGIDNGEISNWNYSSFLRICAYVDNKATYILLDEDKKPLLQTTAYVPSGMVPPLKGGYGLRINLLISQSGKILNWPESPNFKTFAKFGTLPEPVKTNKWYRANKVIENIKRLKLSGEEIERIKNCI